MIRNDGHDDRQALRVGRRERLRMRLDTSRTRLREQRRSVQHTLDLARSAAALPAEAPRTAEMVCTVLTSIATC
jgi:hypothetical protein